METPAIVENCITLVITAVLVLGLYALGAGAFAAVGLLVMLNLNYPRGKRTDD